MAASLNHNYGLHLGLLQHKHPVRQEYQKFSSDKVGAHIDGPPFIALLINDRPGLQVVAAEGEWIDAPVTCRTASGDYHVPVIPGSVIVNTGGTLMHLSEGRYSATLHRVNTTLIPEGETRVSMPYFLIPKMEGDLIPFGKSKAGSVGVGGYESGRDDSTPENHSTEPSIEKMLEFSVDRSKRFLENGCRGFFIMAEASQVDWAGHGNDFEYLMREMSDLEDGIKWALKFAKKNQDTLVVVTADHETGGLLIEPNDPRKYENPDIKFSFNTGIGRGSHTGVPVPIYAYGPGAENFTGTLDNTDVHKALLAAANQDRSGSCVN